MATSLSNLATLNCKPKKIPTDPIELYQAIEVIGGVIEDAIQQEIERHVLRYHSGGPYILRAVGSKIDLILRRLEDDIEFNIVAEEFGHTPTELQQLLLAYWKRQVSE